MQRWPNFLIIGAQKSATTSLYHYLGQHPQIYTSPIKEPKFFIYEGQTLEHNGPLDERLHNVTITDRDQYLALFDDARDEIALGEASTLYLSHDDAARKIAARVPDMKIIVVLRQPAERAHSSYRHMRRAAVEPLETFEEALAAESERTAEDWYLWCRYKDRGFYARHLRRYYQHFDRDRIAVLLFEDLIQQPQQVLAGLFSFLEVDVGFRADTVQRHNISARPRSRRLQRWLGEPHPLKEKIKNWIPEVWGHRAISLVQPFNIAPTDLHPETRRRLTEDYREDIRELEGLIQRDLSHWLR